MFADPAVGMSNEEQQAGKVVAFCTRVGWSCAFWQTFFNHLPLCRVLLALLVLLAKMDSTVLQAPSARLGPVAALAMLVPLYVAPHPVCPWPSGPETAQDQVNPTLLPFCTGSPRPSWTSRSSWSSQRWFRLQLPAPATSREGSRWRPLLPG